MFADINEEMVKQQALFDREWEQATHNRENEAHEQEKLKHLNDQLLTQITVLQNTKGPLHHKKSKLLRRPKTASTLRAGGNAGQTPLIRQNDPTAGQVCHIAA